MVFTTIVNFARNLGNRGPDRFWRRRRTFSLTGVSKLIGTDILYWLEHNIRPVEL